MVKMIPDSTGRFSSRPYYLERELDAECEAVISGFLTKRHGVLRLPVATDELTILIEQHAESLDLYADLSEHGANTEGMTEFFPEAAPKVSVSKHLSTDSQRENRLRSTLAHEFGHVYFHNALWEDKLQPGSLFDRLDTMNKAICRRDTILDAPKYDWMEWQAGYVSGAILMPFTTITTLVSDYCQHLQLHAGVHVDNYHAQTIVHKVRQA